MDKKTRKKVRTDAESVAASDAAMWDVLSNRVFSTAGKTKIMLMFAFTTFIATSHVGEAMSPDTPNRRNQD